MRLEEVPLWFSIGCACLLNFPQLRHTFRTRDVKGLSSITIILRLVGSASWIVYGLLVREALIGISSGVVFISELLLLVMKIRWNATTIAESNDCT